MIYQILNAGKNSTNPLYSETTKPKTNFDKKRKCKINKMIFFLTGLFFIDIHD